MTLFISLYVGKVLHSRLNSSFPPQVTLHVYNELSPTDCVRVCVCVGIRGGVEVCVFSRSYIHKRHATFQYKQQQHVDGVFNNASSDLHKEKDIMAG